MLGRGGYDGLRQQGRRDETYASVYEVGEALLLQDLRERAASYSWWRVFSAILPLYDNIDRGEGSFGFARFLLVDDGG